MIDFTVKEKYVLSDMIALVALLRSEQGCPWDRVQTHESIRRNMIEEAYEAAEAIDQKDPIHLREELGDVLMQVLFHADMERTAGGFDLDEVADAACKKLVDRHPHVFGTAAAEDGQQALDNWDAIKRRQNGHRTHTDAICSVARSLPALMRAEKIQDKARKAGVDKVCESEALEDLAARICGPASVPAGQAEQAVGDLLFAAVRLARTLGVDPELALQLASDRFQQRFAAAEETCIKDGRPLEELSEKMLDRLWHGGGRTDRV